jgi:probable phosphoglycerate mutase
MGMELILIRHGLPMQVATQDGTPADPPLSALGREQATRVADWVRDEQFDRLYSSPMLRARETANPIAEITDMPIEVVDGVAEYDRDADEYIPIEVLKADYPERWLAMVGAGVDEAGFIQFVQGVVASISEVVAANAGKRIAVACHGGVINAWTAHVLGIEPRLFFNPGYTSINRYLVARSGERSIVSLNECAHLRDMPGSADGPQGG